VGASDTAQPGKRTFKRGPSSLSGRAVTRVGYARATTREIARYAQLSPGAHQYQFGGKEH